MITILVQTHWSTACVQHFIFLQIYACSSVFSKASQTYCLTKFSSNRCWLFLHFFKRTESGNYLLSFHLTTQPVTDVNTTFSRQRSDLKNLFPHKYPQFSAFLRQTFQLLHRNPTWFAITTSQHMTFTYNTVMITIHKFSITRSQFLSIFYFHYAIMLMMYKWLHCLP